MWVCYWINNETDEIGCDDIAFTEYKLRSTNLEYSDWIEDNLGFHSNPENFPDHTFFIERYTNEDPPVEIDVHLYCEELYETRDERLRLEE